MASRGSSFVTVTKAPETGRCRWCGSVLPASAGTGRPRLFCRRSCRQRHYEDRLTLEREVRSQHQLDDLADQVFVLAGAVGDAERLLGRSDQPDADDQRVALVWLLEAARPLVAAAGELPAARD